MTEPDELATAYMNCRPQLVRVAYAILGSLAEAEDVVSDCWLRLAAANEREHIADVRAWAILAVGRRALDVLRSARVRRESYVGPWLPEPLIDAMPAAPDPVDRITLDETVSFALMVVLETLSPAERTAWALHELFGVPYTEIATAVGRTPAAVRQLASRARAHVAAGAPRIHVEPGQHRRTVDAFFQAAAKGDMAGLMNVLDPSSVLTSDGGGHVSTALRPIHGADRIARYLVGTVRRLGPNPRVTPLTVNGGPGFAVFGDTSLQLVSSLTVQGERITRIDLVQNPEKLPGWFPQDIDYEGLSS